jgi:hypothetical protein
MDNWPNKDPEDLDDFGIDWTAKLLGAETIASVVWIVPAPLVKASEAINGAVTLIRLSGGVSGAAYTVTCRMTSSTGRQLDRSARLLVIER